jgi:hypothetical protein
MWLLHRTYSDCSRHVHPYYSNTPLVDSGVGKWFLQEKVPTLISAGEIRTVIAGRRAKQTNETFKSWFTKPRTGELGTEDWEVDELHHISPLWTYEAR